MHSAVLVPASHRFVQGKCSIQILNSLITAIIDWMNYQNLCGWFSFTMMWTCRSLYSGSAIPPEWDFHAILSKVSALTSQSLQKKQDNFNMRENKMMELWHYRDFLKFVFFPFLLSSLLHLLYKLPALGSSEAIKRWLTLYASSSQLLCQEWRGFLYPLCHLTFRQSRRPLKSHIGKGNFLLRFGSLGPVITQILFNY